MTTATSYPKRGLPAMHPGELLREDVLPTIDLPKTKIAELLGVSRQTLYDILGEKAAVTPEMALRLGRLCGNGPTFWLNLQMAYDLERESARIASELEQIPTLNAAE